MYFPMLLLALFINVAYAGKRGYGNHCTILSFKAGESIPQHNDIFPDRMFDGKNSTLFK